MSLGPRRRTDVIAREYQCCEEYNAMMGTLQLDSITENMMISIPVPDGAASKPGSRKGSGEFLRLPQGSRRSSNVDAPTKLPGSRRGSEVQAQFVLKMYEDAIAKDPFPKAPNTPDTV